MLGEINFLNSSTKEGCMSRKKKTKRVKKVKKQTIPRKVLRRIETKKSLALLKGIPHRTMYL